MRRLTSITASVALLLLAASANATFNFVSLGDWGCMPIGGWHAQDELIVAKVFQQTTASLNARFILNPGDNFYYCGVHNKSDAMWQSTFEDVFTDPSTNVPWWSALGNHDYGYPGSATAQIEYVSPKNNRWRMPDRYYYERLVFPGEVNISLVVLDASPCQSGYIGNDPSRYDPCGSVIPGCPGCTFHENVVKQSCADQLTWLQGIMSKVPANDWKIAMVHAPASDIDVEDLITPLQNANFDLVVNGHVHLMAHYTMDNAGTYITSGAGCMVKVDQRKGANAQKMLGATSCAYDSKFHSCQIVYQNIIAGFATHTFNEDFSVLTTNLLDSDGNLLHTATTSKGNRPGPPSPPSPPSPPGPNPNPPGPNPPSPPGPSGSCCYWKDSSCTAGQTCCNDKGKSYDQYVCDGDNGKKHNCSWDSSSDKCIVN